MAKQKEKQQHHIHHHHHQQQQRQHVLTYSSSLLLCFTTILLVCDVASGNGNANLNVNGVENHNYTSYPFPAEVHSHHDVPTIETEVQQPSIIQNEMESKTNAAMKSNDLKQNFENPFKALNIVKRAPNGFIGMRGKKDQNADDEVDLANDDNDSFNNPNIDWNLDPLYRALSNNEENYDDNAYYYEGHRFKKAPAAFYGVRGKKLPNGSGNGRPYLNEMLQQLEEERIREQMLQDFIGRLAVVSASQNEINKRAPTGFTGLRGKRPADDWNNHDDEFANGLEYFEKRAPVNAFVGVRGKKDVDNAAAAEVHQTLFKRSPSESYGGGKRRLADFNNKFVAVRGKKEIKEVKEAMSNHDEDEDEREAGAAAEYVARQRLRYFMNSLPSLVYGNDNAKRAPSGFIGMRGKRAANDAEVKPASEANV